MELLVSNDTRKGISQITSPWRRKQTQAPETNKRTVPDLKLILPGGSRYLKV